MAGVRLSVGRGGWGVAMPSPVVSGGGKPRQKDPVGGPLWRMGLVRGLGKRKATHLVAFQVLSLG